MSSLVLVWNGFGFVPATAQDREALGPLKPGDPITARFKRMKDRSYQYHKRFFVLLQLGFDYWEPPGALIGVNEERFVRQFVEYSGRYGANVDVMHALATEFIGLVGQRRAEHFPAVEKSFEAFREWVTVEAGFYNVQITPDGPIKVAKSISFDRMDQLQFQQLYKAAFNVLWRVVLSSKFETEEQAEATANQLMGLA